MTKQELVEKISLYKRSASEYEKYIRDKKTEIDKQEEALYYMINKKRKLEGAWFDCIRLSESIIASLINSQTGKSYAEVLKNKLNSSRAYEAQSSIESIVKTMEDEIEENYDQLKYYKNKLKNANNQINILNGLLTLLGGNK